NDLELQPALLFRAVRTLTRSGDALSDEAWGFLHRELRVQGECGDSKQDRDGILKLKKRKRGRRLPLKESSFPRHEVHQG
ncbi:MAG TPA: hypothetical protein VIX91_23760, partial [Candidatus Acidoferrum sp.]